MKNKEDQPPYKIGQKFRSYGRDSIVYQLVERLSGGGNMVKVLTNPTVKDAANLRNDIVKGAIVEFGSDLETWTVPHGRLNKRSSKFMNQLIR